MLLELATELTPKVAFDMTWTDRSIASISVSVKQLTQRGKLKEPFDYGQIRLHGPREGGAARERHSHGAAADQSAI